MTPSYYIFNPNETYYTRHENPKNIYCIKHCNDTRALFKFTPSYIDHFEKLHEHYLVIYPIKKDRLRRRRSFSLGTFNNFYSLLSAIQFSTAKPGTWLNSLKLAVTRISPCEIAWAAINISLGPIGVPAFSR